MITAIIHRGEMYINTRMLCGIFGNACVYSVMADTDGDWIDFYSKEVATNIIVKTYPSASLVNMMCMYQMYHAFKDIDWNESITDENSETLQMLHKNYDAKGNLIKI